MAAPILFAGIPLLVAPLVYLLNRTRLVATGLSLLVVAILGPFGPALAVWAAGWILGRSSCAGHDGDPGTQLYG